MPEPPPHRPRYRRSYVALATAPPEPEHQPQAAEALRFIRETMQQAGAFTAISGRGLLVIGGTALVASWIASRQAVEGWLLVWLAEVCLAGLTAGVTIYRKAVATRTPLFSGPARKVAMGLLPAMAAGGVLTAVFYVSRAPELIAPMWLLLYGVGVMAGGAWSVAAVPVMGATFMAISLPAFFWRDWPNVWMALGFGVLHIVFGLVVTKKYGG
jgi:hypothetical protein